MVLKGNEERVVMDVQVLVGTQVICHPEHCCIFFGKGSEEGVRGERLDNPE